MEGLDGRAGRAGGGQRAWAHARVHARGAVVPCLAPCLLTCLPCENAPGPCATGLPACRPLPTPALAALPACVRWPAGEVVPTSLADNLTRVIGEGTGEEDEAADRELRAGAVEGYLEMLGRPKLPHVMLKVGVCGGWVAGQAGGGG